jgi:Peptidase family M28
MNRRPAVALLVCLLATPGIALAQKISSATVERVLSTLSADSLQGRATGTPGIAKAARLLTAEFTRIGLQPLPGATSFEQKFEAWKPVTLTASARVGGTALAPANVLVIAGQEQLAWTAGAPEAPRVVVVGPKDDPWKAFWPIRKPKENVVVLLDTAHRKALPEMARIAAHYGMRAERPTHSAAVLLTPNPSPTTAFQLTATARISPIPMSNIVGFLPGRKKARAQEYVVFSGHYDHLGYLPPMNGDSIANGADDDASGTTAVVALAEYYRQHRPARPLIFVAFTAEEIGGFGSQYFSRQLNPAQVVAMFNIEMIGKEAEAGPGGAYITGYEKSTFGALLNENLKGSARFVPDPYPAEQLFYRSDNATLARLGVPAHTISTSRMPADKLYHSVDDESGSLDLPNVVRVIQSIARSATGIVSGQQTPSRVTDAGERK